MDADHLPPLQPGTPRLSSAGVRETSRVPATGDGSRNSLSPRPPRSSAARHDPGAAARHRGNAVDTTHPRMGAFETTQSPRSRRASRTKVVPERQVQGTGRSSCKLTQILGGSPAGSAMRSLEAKAVLELLHDHDTREATLSVLEEHATPIDRAVSLAAAPALVELMASDTSEVGQDQWDRLCLLFARLMAEADDDPFPICSAALGGGRMLAVYQSGGNTMARALLKPAGELTLEDARSIANYYALDAPFNVRGSSKPWTAVHNSVFEFLGMWMAEDPLVSKCAPPPFPRLRHLFSSTR